MLPQLDRPVRQGERERLQRVTAPDAPERAPAKPERGDVATRTRGERPGGDGRPAASDGGGLDAEEQAEVAALARRDRIVRAHEAAHAQAGGRYAGTPSFDYVTGPDGKRYAVAGSVRIDMSTDPSDPEETLRKMEVIRRAALAPVDPSPADRQVARQAERIARAAEADLAATSAAERADIAAAQSERLTRLAVLFAQTSVLPAPEPTVVRAA